MKLGDVIDEHREERSNIRQRALVGNTNGLEKLGVEIAAHPEFLGTKGCQSDMHWWRNSSREESPPTSYWMLDANR